MTDYTKFSNKVARDKTLSLEAKGLLAILLSLPEDWIVNKTQLHKFSNDTKYATCKAFDELVAAGFIKKGEVKKDKGKFKSSDYIVYATRQPLSEPQTSEFQTSDFETLFNKDYTKK